MSSQPRRARAASPRASVKPSVAAPLVQVAAPLAIAFMGAEGRLDMDRITQTFNMTRSQLAETAGLSSDTLQKSARRDAPKTQARVTEMLEIVTRLEAWAGGRNQAMAWYRAQPIAALDGRTAEALVKSGKAGVVRDYLDAAALGGFA